MSKENKESKVDIYSFIASEEIREYFRKNREFSIQEKMRIILTSWKPFTEKMEAISILKTETNGNDYKFVVCIEAIYKDAYERICNPKGTVIFCARSLWRKADEPDLLSLAHASCTYGCTYHEALADWSGYTYPVVLDIDYVDSNFYKDKNPYSFTVLVQDEKYEIIQIFINDKHAYGMGDYEAEQLEIVKEAYDRYSLPFRCGEKIKIVLPYLGEYRKGVLSSQMDGNGCWYHFFYKSPLPKQLWEFEDLSYFWIEWYGNEKFNVFDCLCRDGDEVENKFQVDILSPLRKVNQLIGDGGRYSIKIRLSYVADKFVNGMVPITMKDDTGCVDGFICIRENDYCWLYDVLENQEELCIEGKFDSHEDGTIYMAYSTGVSRLG